MPSTTSKGLDLSVVSELINLCDVLRFCAKALTDKNKQNTKTGNMGTLFKVIRPFRDIHTVQRLLRCSQ